MPLDKYAILINEVEKSITECNSKTINYVDNNQYTKYPDLFFVLLTVRLLTGIESSIVLLKAAKSNTLHLLSIGNILRSGILDCLHFHYLSDQINPSVPENKLQSDLSYN